MATLTGALYTATSALAADQTALTATAENVSNQNTAGYTRRAVTFSEGDTVSIGGEKVSGGVTATVAAVRNGVLQASVQQATSTSSASSARSTALSNLESLFTPTSTGEDSSGIGSAITGFFSAASSLSASPTDSTAQQTLYTAAQTLASALHTTAGQIAAQTSSLNQQVTTSVAQVNGLLTQVASLNQQAANATGDSLDTLVDERDQLVTQISGLVGVNTVSAGQNTLNVTLADGTPLIAGTTALQLTTATISGVTHIYAASATGGADVTGAITGGTIGGALQARDQDLPAVTSQLDTLAQTIATAVNTQNAAGVTSSGAAAGAIFSGTTAATLAVSASSANALAVSSSTSGGGDNALAISNLQDADLVNGQTLSGSFASLLSGLGQTASSASTASTADATVLSQASAQLTDVSGVSLDQEAANLTQYQRSYEAAAKVLSIVDELMAQAINLGIPTTVS